MACAGGLAALFLTAPLPQPRPSRTQLLLSLAITAAFALLAAVAHGVNVSGALAGSAVAFILAARELKMFAVLLVVFAVTLAATRLGAERKRQLRKAEPAGGRSASQVMANLGIAALIITVAPAQWKVLALASLAEAAADTSSSEIGLAFPGKTVLITDWTIVSPGVDGGISWLGTLAAVVAAALVALTARLLGLITTHLALAVVYAGFLGSVADSVLGAVLERRGYLNNDLVNLLSTAIAAAIAWAML
jgi:uncharacterized protein (TIGR00297 family)